MFDKETMDKIVKAGVLGAIGEDNLQKMFDEFIHKILTTKVNKNGGTNYDSYGGGSPDTPYLDYVVQGELKKIIEKAIRGYIAEREAELTQQFLEKITQNGEFAESMLRAVTDRINSGYVNLNIDFVKERD